MYAISIPRRGGVCRPEQRAAAIDALLFETSNAGLRDRVVLGLAIVLGAMPGALDPPFLLQPHEGRIQRPLIERQRLFRHLFETGGQRVRVLARPS